MRKPSLENAERWTPEQFGLLTILLVAIVCGGAPFGSGDFVVHATVLLVGLPLLACNAGAIRKCIPVAWLVWWGLLGAWLAIMLASQWLSVGPWAETGDIPGQMRALFAWFSAFIIFILSSYLVTTTSCWRILQMIAVATCVTAFLGFLQAASPEPLKILPWIPSPDARVATGFFSNRNHFACLMSMLLPIAIVSSASAFCARRHPQAVGWILTAMCLLLGALLSYSRMGTMLGLLALLFMIAMVFWLSRREHFSSGHRAPMLMPLFALLGVAALVLWGGYAWDAWLGRLQRDPLADLRWQLFRNGLHVMQEALPWGTGFGSFANVYATFEPVHEMQARYVRHAHNDALQVCIEGGLAAFGLMCVFLVMVVAAATKRFASISDGSDRLLQAISILIAISLALVHSLLDYPLRTHAVLLVFATFLAFFVTQSQVRSGS